MLVITCPHCRAAVVPLSDGSCPACGRAIPAQGAQPFVIQSGYGVSEDSRSPGAGQPAPFGPQDLPGAWGESPQQAHLRFWLRLIELTPHTLITPAIVAVNVVIFVLMAIDSGGIFSFHGQTLLKWGGNFGPWTLDGQWWRLLTCTFVHGGLIHIGLNMWVLWDIGQFVERLTGNVGFLLLYVLSGLFGSLASVYWNPEVLSVGASGAVFGAFGGLMGFVLLRHDSIPKHILARLRVSGSTFLFFNLIVGLRVPGIDMAAHLGGLVAGFACGLVLTQPLDRVTILTRTWRNAMMVALGTVSLAAALALAPAAPAVPAREAPVALPGRPMPLLAVEQKLLETYQIADRQYQHGKLSAQKFAEVIETQILPPWRAARRSFDKIDARRIAAEPNWVDVHKRYMLLREQAWEAMAAGLKAGGPRRLEEAREKNAAADRLGTQAGAGR